MQRGKLLVYEGGEGTGKTTTIDTTYNWIIEHGFKCIKTREPGGIKISEQIRQVILNTENTMMDPKTEALLYAAARRQHLVEKVIPALENGVIVLCDRFVCSSLAYQGYARGLGIDEILDINKFAIGDCMPDMNILFDLEPEIGLKRISDNGNREVNRLDLEKLDFHKKVREGYLQLTDKFPNTFTIINANQTPQEVFIDTIKVISKILNVK